MLNNLSKLFETMGKFFTTASIRSSLAIIVTLLSFGIIYKVVWDAHVTVEEMGVITAIIGVQTFILGYYFGTSKNETDKNKKDLDNSIV
jgi:hypothetical protein